MVTANKQIPIHALISDTISKPMKNYDRRQITELYPYVRELNLAPQCPGDIYQLDVLIGADFYWQVIKDNIVRGDGPTCVDSELGYILSGPVHLPQSGHTYLRPTDSVLSILCLKTNAVEVSQYWEIENMGLNDESSSDLLNSQNKLNLQTYINEKIKFSNGQYEAGLTWNDNKLLIRSDYASSVAQTRAMINRLSLKQRLAMHSIIMEQLKRGFIEKSPDININRGHYLKYYGIQKSSSSSTPLRLVYRCNSKVGRNPSLNDCLEPGITLLNDLGGILMRFRLFHIAIMADIEKAFLHVALAMEDREFTKFLWLAEPTEPDSDFIEYRFASILFGATCSPFILNAVLLKHAQSHDSEISQKLIQDIYVDNVLSSVPDVQTAEKFYKESNALLAEGGFKLRQWSSNSVKIRQQAMADELQSSESTAKVNALGMNWDSDRDIMSCKPLSKLSDNQVINARNCLSQTARLYDVPGFLLPVHVRAKLLLQELQKKQKGWKEQLSVDDATKWKEIYEDLRLASEEIKWDRIAIKGLTPQTPVQVHIFVDASLQSYGAAAFLVGNGQSALIWAKNKLTPLKGTPRIPRLELNSCLVGALLFTYIKKHIGHCVNIVKSILWSDNQSAICWIKSTKKLEAYILRRVVKILAAGFSEIKFCPTTDNPCDLLTRGITARQLKDSTLWKSGPGWLLTGEYPQWEVPTSEPISVYAVRGDALQVIPEDDNIPPAHTNREGLGLIKYTKYSTMRRLLSTSIIVLRFVRKLRQTLSSIRQRKLINAAVAPTFSNVHNDKSKFVFNRQEFKDARLKWIIIAQDEELSDIKHGLLYKQRKKRPTVHHLNLFIDDKGVIRKGSRLQHALIKEETKFPILLPANHYITKLIVKEAHSQCLHGGVDHTVNLLRQTFWIAHMRTKVKSILRKCVTCQKVNSRPYRVPSMPPLPKWRLDSDSRSFHTVGVDYTGEIHVKNDDKIKKVYIVLYTCAVSRGVHLELARDLSTEQFIKTFRKFCAKKSIPNRVVSDNASYFKAASGQITQILTHPEVINYMSERNIRWDFIAKRAAWFGAFYERLIQIVKRTLQKVLGNALLSFDDLDVTLAEVEATMNDRPITYVGGTDDAPIAISPSLLMYGRRITPFPQLDFDKDEDYNPKLLTLSQETATRSAKRISELINNYWKRYLEEYLPALRDRDKLAADSKDTSAKVGDIVLVHDDTKKRPLWKIARITKLFNGADGFSRVAEIRTAKRTTNRPLAKLYPLEINHETNELKDTNTVKDPVLVPHRPRPVRRAAVIGRDKVRKMINYLADED